MLFCAKTSNETRFKTRTRVKFFIINSLVRKLNFLNSGLKVTIIDEIFASKVGVKTALAGMVGL